MAASNVMGLNPSTGERVHDVYWRVSWRWVVSYGTPEKVVSLLSVSRKQAAQTPSRYIVTNNYSAACDMADNYRYGRLPLSDDMRWG